MLLKTLKFLVTPILLMVFITPIHGQNDVILKTSGEEMIGQVTQINQDDIHFVHQNETLEYTLPKSEITKITFSSGRIEHFTDDRKLQSGNLEDHHNKVAILPFGYIKDQETSNPTMTKKIQQETFTIFKKKAGMLAFQDPNTTNALLAKAGVTNNIEGYTMGEICQILGVEYVIQGLVSIERSSVTNYSNSQTKSKGSNNAYVDSKGKIVGDWNNENKRTTNSFSTTTQNYATTITMNVYTDRGENVFSQDHQSFWQTQDAYKITLQYLAKRTPVYKKYGIFMIVSEQT